PNWLQSWISDLAPDQEVSLDLETTMDMGSITQVSLSARPYEAVVFDCEEEYLIELLRLLRRPVRFVGQNIVMFDSLRLAELTGAEPIRIYADLMLAHHLRQSPAPHDLGFINSCYARDPYYKDQIQSDRHQYAAKDADCTLRCWKMVEQELRADGQWN